MKRIAAPLIGGVVTSAILELLIYPVIFVILAAFVAEGHTR
jgi:copper/silver efflux system protein